MHVRRGSVDPVKPATLDADTAQFLQSGVSIVVTASDKRNLPHLSFAPGCRVAGRSGRVRVFLAEPRSHRLIEAIRETGRIAVVFSRPDDNRTLQLKSTNAVLASLTAADRTVQSGYIDKLSASLAKIGVAAELIHVIMSADRADLVAVDFAPSAVFSQTPGPLAGRPVST